MQENQFSFLFFLNSLLQNAEKTTGLIASGAYFTFEEGGIRVEAETGLFFLVLLPIYSESEKPQ